MTRYAIIINGDTEARHLGNVDASLKVLNKEGYETYVASVERPEERCDSYRSITNGSDVQGLISELKQKLTADDELVVYVTGHGAETGFCVDSDCNAEGLLEGLDGLNYGKRVIVSDYCYAGNSLKRFADDPGTIFISPGSAGESVCCDQFAPYFWSSDVTDYNADGAVNWDERYRYTFERGLEMFARTEASRPNFVRTEGFENADSGRFGEDVRSVRTWDEYQTELKRLAPGEYAVVVISSKHCPVCKEYSPAFGDQAAQGKGKHLFIWSDGEEISERLNIREFPTVFIIDYSGNSFQVSDRDGLEGELKSLYLTGERLAENTGERVLQILSALSGENKLSALKAFYLISLKMEKQDIRLSEQDFKEAERLLRGLLVPKSDISPLAIQCYNKLVDMHEHRLDVADARAAADVLLSCLGTDDVLFSKFALYSLSSLLRTKSIAPDDAKRILERVRQYFSSEMKYWSDGDLFFNDVEHLNRAYVSVYRSALDLLTPEDRYLELQNLHSMFDRPETAAALRELYAPSLSYNSLFEGLPQKDLLKEVEFFKGLLASSDYDKQRSAISSFWHIMFEMDDIGEPVKVSILKYLVSMLPYVDERLVPDIIGIAAKNHARFTEVPGQLERERHNLIGQDEILNVLRALISHKGYRDGSIDLSSEMSSLQGGLDYEHRLIFLDELLKGSASSSGEESTRLLREMTCIINMHLNYNGEEPGPAMFNMAKQLVLSALKVDKKSRLDADELIYLISPLKYLEPGVIKDLFDKRQMLAIKTALSRIAGSEDEYSSRQAAEILNKLK